VNPPTPRPTAARCATSLLFLANGLGIGAWAAAIPLLQRRLQLSTGRLSLVLLAFAAGAVVAMPLAGLLGARLGTRRASLGAGLVFTASLLLPQWAATLPALAAVGFLLGAGNGALDVAMNAHASQVEADWGAAIMSSFHAAFSFGGLAGAALAGWLARGLPGAELGLSLALPAWLALALVLAAWPGLGPGAPVAPPEAPAGPGRARLDRAMLALCAMALLCMLVEGAMADWSAVYLASLGDVARAAGGYAAFSLAMAVARLTGDRFVRWLGGGRVIQVGGWLAALGLALAALAPGQTLALPGFALVGIGLANVVPAVFSRAARQAPAASMGIAMAASAGYAGFLSGPPAMGLVIAWVGLRAAMAGLALAALAVALLGWRSGRRPVPADGQPEAA
jgi:MFS family permease